MFHSHPLPLILSTLSSRGSQTCGDLLKSKGIAAHLAMIATTVVRSVCRILCLCMVFVLPILAHDGHLDDLRAELAEDERPPLMFATAIQRNDIGGMEAACREYPLNVNDPIFKLHPFAFALAANSSNAVLDWLLARGVALNAMLPGMEFTPLTLAVAQGKERAVRYLLGRRDVEINVPNANGRNALGLAVVFYREAAPWILEKGGDVLQVDDKGMTPWGLAIQSKVPCLVTDDQGNKIPFSKVVSHDMDIIAAMLRRAPTCVDSTFKWGIEMVDGKDSNKKWRREDDFTALHVAAAMGNEELVRLIYSHSASLNVQSPTFRLTPLMAALSTRQENTARMLVNKYGADLTCTDKEGWNAVMHAVAADLPDAITFLHEKGASFAQYSVEHNGEMMTISPLNVAICWAKEAVACHLVELGAPLDKKDESGLVPMFVAVDQGRPKVLDAILKKGANPNMVCPNDLYILVHAVFMPGIEDEARMAMYQLLVKAGATTDGVDQEIADGIKEWEKAAFPDGLPS